MNMRRHWHQTLCIRACCYIELAHFPTLNLDRLNGTKWDYRTKSYRRPKVLSILEAVFRISQQFQFK